MNKNRKLLAALVLPIVILLGGAGVGLVVAAEKPYSPPSGSDAFAAAPASLVLASTSGSGASSSQSARSRAALLKRKCRKKKPAAKRSCLRRVNALLRPRYMPLERAENIALGAAERAWASNDGEYEWTDFGLADCRRLARNSVSCAVYVYYEQSQYGYDDYGSIYDCEWVVNSKYVPGGGLKVSGSFASRQCEWL